METISTHNVVSSLDEAVGPGAEMLVMAARKRRLLQGVAVGVIRDGKSWLRFYGNGVGPSSMFEVGSVTKTYTAELLARLVEGGVVRLDDPVALYLPGGLRAHGGPRPVTLLDLATHRSGEPRLPPGLRRLNRNPYRRYSIGDLETYLAARPLQVPETTKFEYSNLGYSILGYALARASGVRYVDLLQREILDPLAMHETSLALGQARPQLLRGHTQTGLPTSHWTFDAFAPCGALCSTAGDQLKWLAWLLQDPDRLSLRPHAAANGGEVGLGWMIRGDSVRWHTGATFGFSNWISLDRERRTGLVILSQVYSPTLISSLALEFERCFAGVAPQPLKGDYGRRKAWVLDLLLLAASPAGVLERFACA